MESKRFVKVGMDLLTPARDSKEKLALSHMQIKRLDTFSVGIFTSLKDEGTNKGSYCVCSSKYLFLHVLCGSRSRICHMLCAVFYQSIL